MLARTKRDLYGSARWVVLILGALALSVAFHQTILEGPDAQARKFKAQTLFEAIDKNGDGYILIEEFIADHNEPFVQAWMLALLENSFWYQSRVPDDYSYFLQPPETENWSATISARLGAIHKSIDADGDDRVAESELYRWISVRKS
jgi:hypothetical protein